MIRLYPPNYEHKIGFLKIRNLLKENCVSDLGRTQVDALFFNEKKAEIEAELGKVYEFLPILQQHEDFPCTHYHDLRESLHAISTEGRFLSESDLFALKQTLDSLHAVLRFLEHRDTTSIPQLKQLCTETFPQPDLCKRLENLLDKFGTIKDQASSELARIRQERNRLNGSITRLLGEILHKAQTEGYVDADIRPTLREGRLVIPISPMFRRKIGGIVHDESATGKTVFVEPTAVVEANNKIRSLEAEEKREITRILQNETAHLRPLLPELKQDLVFLGKIDYVRARALFALQTEAMHLPELVDEPLVDWKGAKHPILLASLREQGKEIVPLDIQLSHEHRLLLISGPNAGGKSVCLKTVALLQYMVQCAIPIALSAGSRVGLFHQLFIDIGDEQSIENDLSTYSSHLLNIKFFLKHTDHRSLLLMDELGAGTEPLMGGAIAEAALEALNQKQSFGVITTHYTNLKHLASRTPGLINGAMLYDRQQMQALFQLAIGHPGASFAVEIARKIGLPETIIAAAAQKVGSAQMEYDKNLQDIARDKRYWESKRQQIHLKEKKMDETTRLLQTRLDEIDYHRKEIVRQAKEEAKQLLADTNATIENTIREIKEAKAEKERTKQARRQLEQTRRQMEPTAQEQTHSNSPTTNHWAVGDYVNYHGNIGQVIAVQGKKLRITFGQLEALIKPADVEKANYKQHKEQQRSHAYSFISQETAESIRQRKLNFKHDIDVRGQRAEEALQTVMYFIDDALVSGAGQVRILHGTGTGTLRELIRQYLRTVPGVRSTRDEHVQLGGSGITIVELE